MTRRIALLLLFAALPLGAANKTAAAKPEPPRAVTVDTHADTPSEYLDRPFDLGAWNARGHFDYPRMKAGNLDAEFFAAYVPRSYADKGAAAYCMKIMETIHEMVEHYPSSSPTAWKTSASCRRSPRS